MLANRALAIHDAGATLSHVIDQLLLEAGESRKRVAILLLKAALVMPDSSQQRIATPVEEDISPGAVRVCDTVIAIDGLPNDRKFPTGQKIIILYTMAASTPRRKQSARIESYLFANFVGQMVNFRAAFSGAAIRRWLAHLP